MTTHTDLDEIVGELFASAERGDWDRFRALCAPDAVLCQNVGVAAPIDQALPGLKALTAGGTVLRYENVRRFIGSNHVTELHDAVFTKPDGTEVRIDICVVLQFDNMGLITRADEYLDANSAKPLFVDN